MQGWAEEGFYKWTYDLPTSPWLLIGSVGLAAAVLLLCLFPLAPYKLKIAVVYASLGLVSLLLGTILLRWVVAGATWFLAGRALWLLPNMLSEVSNTLLQGRAGVPCLPAISGCSAA